jgi:1-acyl-sn-glycerol-3-phosphate acyltransferase
LHLGGSELFLYGILAAILEIDHTRTGRTTHCAAPPAGWRAVSSRGLPYGKLEFRNITTATFAPPCIVISNHQSAVDVMLVVSLPGDVRQTAKKRVFDTPILGIGCKLLGHVMVEPNNPATTLRRCREKLAEGASVHFYPEGTRSVDGFLQRFHRGAFELAVELKQEILPILLCDTNHGRAARRLLVRAIPRHGDGSAAASHHRLSIMRKAVSR